MSKVGLLDLDSWVYRCGYAAEKTHYLVYAADHDKAKLFDNYKDAKAFMGPDGFDTLWSRKEIEPVENCLQTVKSSLENTINVLGLTSFVGFLSGRGNFREAIFPDYKANRETFGKPKHYRAIRDYLVRQWRAVLVDGMEADDAIGIAAKAAKHSFVVVGVDKDLNQVVGEHYNWVTGEQYRVSPQESIRFFYEQLLSGDPTDNIPGIPGIGEVKAAKALVDCKTPNDCAKVVYDHYAVATNLGPTELRKLIDRNASLVWIKRTKEDSHPFWKHYEQ